jgi:hypothetical protein
MPHIPPKIPNALQMVVEASRRDAPAFVKRIAQNYIRAMAEGVKRKPQA